jgi:hypothetical protein
MLAVTVVAPTLMLLALSPVGLPTLIVITEPEDNPVMVFSA